MRAWPSCCCTSLSGTPCRICRSQVTRKLTFRRSQRVLDGAAASRGARPEVSRRRENAVFLPSELGERSESGGLGDQLLRLGWVGRGDERWVPATKGATELVVSTVVRTWSTSSSWRERIRSVRDTR